MQIALGTEMHKWVLMAASLSIACAGEVFPSLARAQADFDRVAAAQIPVLSDTWRCVQSQAEALPVARPAEVPVIRFRKGYCQLMVAVRSGNVGEYQAAAGDFARAIAAWENRPGEPLPSGFQVLSAITRIQGGADAAVLPAVRAELEDAETRSYCPAGVTTPAPCREVLDAGRLWLGWLAAREGNLAGAEEVLSAFPELAWASWLAGRRKFEARRFAEAASALDRAVRTWTAERQSPHPGLLHLLSPPPEIPAALLLLGEAQYRAGQYAAAIGTLDAAVRTRPGDAQPLFLRGLARDGAGQPEAAAADYQLASRTAFADTGNPFSSGRAHYYRGAWLYRRKDYAHAEDEFASALNFGAGPQLRPDAAAWRYMAAVASGSCENAARDLESALPAVSGLFPAREAHELIQGCQSRAENVARK